MEFDEIDSYLNTSNDINTDPLLWWKEHQNEYPILSLIAKDYLSIQATSVAAEQAFSVAGNTIENEIGINHINNEIDSNTDTDSNYTDSSDTDSDANNTDSN